MVAITSIKHFIVDYLAPELGVEIEAYFNVFGLFYSDLVVVVYRVPVLETVRANGSVGAGYVEGAPASVVC